MSIGYDSMTAYDFNSYMCESYAFKYDKRRRSVRAYVQRGIYDPTPDLAREFEARLSCVTTGDDVSVPVVELFDSYDWVTHRFPTGYVAINGGEQLVRVALEPWERRMRKGLDFASLRFLPVLDTVEELPDGLVGRITASRHSVSIGCLLDGICSQLAFGYSRAFEQVIPRSVATERSKRAVAEMLDNDINALAISPELALIKNLAEPASATVINNGRVLGTVAYDEESKLVLSGTALRDYSDKALRSIAKEGITSLAMRTIADKVTWVY